jgi:hypothetical protein
MCRTRCLRRCWRESTKWNNRLAPQLAEVAELRKILSTMILRTQANAGKPPKPHATLPDVNSQL